MLEPKNFNEKATAEEAIINSPEISDRIASASEALNEDEPEVNEAPKKPVEDDGVCLRHGIFASKMFNSAKKEATGEELDKDTRDTLGDIFGEVFSGLSRHTLSKPIYYGVLLASCLPFVGFTIIKMTRSLSAKAKASDFGEEEDV